MSEIKMYGVAGKPILHSRSPDIFNFLFQKKSLDFIYTKILTSSPEEVISIFKNIDFQGMNITAPLKEKIIPFLDDITLEAEKIGSVNTIVRIGERIKGYNTDYIGVLNAFKKNNVVLKNKKCVVLGAGGAGRAAAYALSKEDAQVTIINRTVSKAREISEEFSCSFDKIENLTKNIKNSDIFISTIYPEIDLIPEEALFENLLVFDANYSSSSLTRLATHKGCKVIYGYDWLLQQALASLKIFTGLDYNSCDFSFSNMISKLNNNFSNIVLIGFMGVGKTFIGNGLAEKMGLQFLDTDCLIEKEENLKISDIFDKKGESYFRDLETRIFNRVKKMRNAVIACGGGAILNTENCAVIRGDSIVIWLVSSIETALKRIENGTRPLLSCLDPLKFAQDLFKKRIVHYASNSDMIVDTENKNEDVVISEIYEAISKIRKN